MGMFQKNAKRDQNITKYKVGDQVQPNKKANKIVAKTLRDIKNTKRKWI